MNRRAFFGAAAALTAAGGVAAQDSARVRDSAAGAADPLRDPEAVGQLRAVTTKLDNADEIKAIEYQLKCTCGCNLDIFTCRTTDFTCTYSPALHQEVVGLYTAGKNADEIIAAFVAKYGESVLLAPKPKGFNLVGYLLPSAAVLVAAGILGMVLLRRHRQRLLATAAVAPARTPADLNLTPEQRERLERAMGEIQR